VVVKMSKSAAGMILGCAFLIRVAVIAGAQDMTPAQTFISGKDIILNPPERGYAQFRFLPNTEWIAFDRNLELSAVLGEARVYLVQVDSGEGGDAPVMAYVIDKRRPAPPRAEPGTGVYREDIAPVLTAEEGVDIYWSLIGPGSPMNSFSVFSDETRPRMKPPAAGTATYSLLAYAVDPYGNRSEPVRFIYRLAEANLLAEAPTETPAATAIAPKTDLPAPALEERRGGADLIFNLPAGADLYVDVGPLDPPDSFDDFTKLEVSGGVARLSLNCPYGWSGEIPVFYGYLMSGRLVYAPDPIAVSLSYPPDERPLPLPPAAPEIAADYAGRGAFCVFPAYDGEIYVSIDRGAVELYSAPIPIQPGKDTVLLSWYGIDGSGRRSETREKTADLPTRVQDITLIGVEEGAVVGKDVTLKPSSPALIRYEIRVDGTLPPEPSAASKAIGESLVVSCPPGEERQVVIRYRPFIGATAGEGKVLRFAIDRRPPEPPKPSELPPSYTERSRSISIEPGPGTSTVYVSVSADGKSSGFTPASGPIELAGAESGPVSYMIRAYGVDAAGNKSAEMKAISLIVDRSSVYAAEDGFDRGDGSPDRPFRSLDDAIAAALASGKRSVNLRGSLELRSPVISTKQIDIVGGFGKQWIRDTSVKASIRISVPGSASPFSQSGSSLTIRNVEVSAPRSGPAPLITGTRAQIILDNCSISAGGDGDVVVLSAMESTISASNVRIAASRAMSCTVFACESSSLRVAESTIEAAAATRVFCAFDMYRGSLDVKGTLIESYADIALNMLSMRESSLSIDRSLCRADAGSGFLRIGSFTQTKGEIRNTKILVSWKQTGTLFEISDGGPDFRHDTVIADSERGRIKFFEISGQVPQIWNSIFACTKGGSDFISTRSVPRQGSISANCIWGFERLIAGAVEIRSLMELNTLNAASALNSSRPNISEPPSETFASPVKSLTPINPKSLCVDAAIPLDGIAYAVDFRGLPRPAPGTPPDIGADESSK
jgi:hypothetical protein